MRGRKSRYIAGQPETPCHLNWATRYAPFLSDVLGRSTMELDLLAEGRRIFVIQLISLLVFFAPILVSAFLVVFKGKRVRGRWLFLVVGPLVVYTILWLAMLVFMVPAWFVLTWFTPAVKEIVSNTPFWYPFYSWVAKYDGYIASVVCFALSIWLVGHFWPRWPKILEALAAPEDTVHSSK